MKKASADSPADSAASSVDGLLSADESGLLSDIGLILSTAELQQQPSLSPDRQKELSAVIEKSCYRLLRRTGRHFTRLRGLENVSDFTPAVFVLKELVGEAVASASRCLADSGVTVVSDLSHADNATVLCDREKLVRIIFIMFAVAKKSGSQNLAVSLSSAEKVLFLTVEGDGWISDSLASSLNLAPDGNDFLSPHFPLISDACFARSLAALHGAGLAFGRDPGGLFRAVLTVPAADSGESKFSDNLKFLSSVDGVAMEEFSD